MADHHRGTAAITDEKKIALCNKVCVSSFPSFVESITVMVPALTAGQFKQQGSDEFKSWAPWLLILSFWGLHMQSPAWLPPTPGSGFRGTTNQGHPNYLSH